MRQKIGAKQKQKNDLKFRIKELKEDFFESELTFNNKKIKSIDTLRYLKIISIISFCPQIENHYFFGDFYRKSLRIIFFPKRNTKSG